MATVKSTTFKACGLELHALEAGEGQPVLFVHGWPTNAQLWRHVLAEVGETRRAIAIDLPGFGQSAKPLDAAYDFKFYDQVFDESLAALGVDRLGLCVHDAGGALGLHWAVQHPDRISELCLLNTVASAKASWAVVAFILLARTPLLCRLTTTQWGIASGMRYGVQNRNRLTPEVIELYTAPFRDPNARAVFIRAVRALSKQRGGMKRVEAGLTGFAETPLRLIYGAHDRILPGVARTMRFVQKILPHAELTELTKLGHFLQEDSPEEVAALVAEFFARRQPEVAVED